VLNELDKTAQKYIKSVLTNDETSTDEELIELFMRELHFTRIEASYIIEKRDYYLNKI